jgi:arylsulfatase A-like enzyme
MLSRRHFVLGTTALPALAAKNPPTARPNIVLILADDLPAWMVGCYGNKEVRTPNIDRLAQTGARFAHSFTSASTGTGSRATLFTGRTPMQHGIEDAQAPDPPAAVANFARETALSDLLAGLGYNCGYTGKWHLGNDDKPQHHCDFWYTLQHAAQPYQNPKMNFNGQPVEEKGYLADLITAKACQFITQQKADKPFFLTVAHFNAHPPYDGHPQKYYDLYAQSKFEAVGWENPSPRARHEKEMLADNLANIRRFAAATTALDDQLPPLLDCLRKQGLLDNTIVIFTSDNGYLLGRHGLWSHGLASEPFNMYDETVAVPMIWSWPLRIPPASVRPEMVSFHDVLPTLCELTGAALPPNLCGRSYLAPLTSKPLPKKEPWRQQVYAHFRTTSMVRDNRFKLVLRNEGAGPNELYDVSADPRERVNQYDNPQFVTVRDRLAPQLAAWRKQYGR